MDFEVRVSEDKNEQKIAERIAYGGSSDDTEPFKVRNLLWLDLFPKGLINRQNFEFAFLNIVSKLPSPYSDFLEKSFLDLSFLKGTCQFLPRIQIKDFLDQAYIYGTVSRQRGFFAIPKTREPEKISTEILSCFEKPFDAYFISNLLKVRHCWNYNLMIISQKKCGICSWFTYD